MYFDLEDYRPDTPTLESAISRREGILLSLGLHLLAGVLLVFAPSLPFIRDAAEARAARLAEIERQLQEARERERTRFVFVQPRVDLEALQPDPQVDASDKDRVARALERAERPGNPLPFARGNSSERVEATPPERPLGNLRAEEPGQPEDESAGAEAKAQADRGAVDTPAEDRGRFARAPAAPSPSPAPGRSPIGGSLREALSNLQRYVQAESFDNPQGGGGQFGPSIQFDTKGVEFGPWIRRFVAQIRRNWFIPYAAMALKGHVVITFNVHRDGTISDLTIVQPSAVDAFNTAAFNALLTSNPTQPLPPEYPADRAFFTVTFYYNESPTSP